MRKFSYQDFLKLKATNIQNAIKLATQPDLENENTMQKPYIASNIEPRARFLLSTKKLKTAKLIINPMEFRLFNEPVRPSAPCSNKTEGLSTPCVMLSSAKIIVPQSNIKTSAFLLKKSRHKNIQKL